jgi:hypothetical protein
MRKCTGNNTQEWGAEAIFDEVCKGCGEPLLIVSIIAFKEKDIEGVH